jgi:hypothetical protein
MKNRKHNVIIIPMPLRFNRIHKLQYDKNIIGLIVNKLPFNKNMVNDLRIASNRFNCLFK